MDNKTLKSILNIVPYIFIVAIIIIGLFAFNIIPTSRNKTDTISFTEKNVRLEKNNSIQLSINSSSNKVKYKSDNTSIATVNENTGYVTGVNVGKTKITAYIDGNSEIYDECIVEVYINTIEVDSVEIIESNINMRIGETRRLSAIITPSNATNKNLTWETSNSNVLTVNNNGLVTAIKDGHVTVTVRTSNGKSASTNITVTKGSDSPTKPKVEKLVVTSGKVSLRVDEYKKIEYRVEPSNAEITSIKWITADPSVATVDNNGNVRGIKEGTVGITLIINNTLRANITVTVNPKLSGINLKSAGVLKLKVGQTSQIQAETIPVNSGVKLTYKSNNNHVTVSDSGLVKAVSAGNSLVTISAGNFTRSVNITVTKPSTTPPSDPPGGDPPVSVGGVWGYSDSKTVSPVRADASFFQNLANSGTGTMSGNVYSYAGYSYYISTSNLVYNGRSSLIRIYYPRGVDLSNVNTLAFLGGTGERNMGGMFSAIDRNTSMIKSSGIIILVSTTGSYHYQDAINATNFVKAITKQRSGKKNSVAGYSLGGPAAGGAMVNGNYNRLFIIHARVELSHTSRLKNKTIYVYSPKGDSQEERTRETLTALKNDGAGKNVTLVSNNTSLINTFGSYFTIVNPGSAQGSGHGYVNFVNGNLFAFACSD